ncbi:MAG: homocysteine methyltransferase [Acidobacteriota bacterium]|nr:homocysteine methyltransferase [Acidobacteriota bacterium]
MPDPNLIIEIMDGFRRSKAMFAAVELGVFDLLAEAPLSAAEVARRLNANDSGVLRLLETCFSMGLLTLRDGLFANTEVASAYLCRSSPQSLIGYIDYSNRVLYDCWGHLEDAVREGTPRWAQTYGTDRPIFEHFFSTPEKMRTFTMGMHGLGLTASPSVVRAFDLSRFRTIADLGAATGHLAIAACEAWPNLHGIVFDFPKVLPMAKEYIARSPAKFRLRAQPGDFFADDLPEADLYALGRVLHDWPEEKIDLLLRKIHEKLPPGGALLVAEKLILEDRSGPLSAHLQSLSMLVVTEGRERSLSEYSDLLRAAGFHRVEGKCTGTYLDAILARKD